MNETRRRFSLGAALLSVIAITLALITLLGLEPLPLLPDTINKGAATISQMLIQLVTVVGAIAVIIGIFNLIGVHRRNVWQGKLSSLLTLITFVAIVIVRILERRGILTMGDGTVPTISLTTMDVLQVAIESALAGILFFFLVFAAYRLMRRGVTLWNVLFVASLVIVLVGYIPLSGMDFLSALRDWFLRVPVGAGTRGLLIGIAIGTVVVGVRVLIGQDRTFRE